MSAYLAGPAGHRRGRRRDRLLRRREVRDRGRCRRRPQPRRGRRPRDGGCRRGLSAEPAEVRDTLAGLTPDASDGLAGPALDFSSPAAVSSNAVVFAAGHHAGPGPAPGVDLAGAPRLYWLRVARPPDQRPATRTRKEREEKETARATRDRAGRGPPRGRDVAVRRDRHAGRPGRGRSAGPRSPGRRPLWVDDSEHTGQRPAVGPAAARGHAGGPFPAARDRRSRSAVGPPWSRAAWEAGRTVPVPSKAGAVHRSLRAGRPGPSTRPAPRGATPRSSTPWRPWARSQTRAREGQAREGGGARARARDPVPGSRIKDEGSTNGTFVDGVKVPGGARHRRGGRRSWGGTAITLRPEPGRDARPRSGQSPQRHHGRHRAVQPAARPGRPPQPDPVVPPERTRTRRRPTGSAWPPSWRRCCSRS